LSVYIHLFTFKYDGSNSTHLNTTELLSNECNPSFSEKQMRSRWVSNSRMPDTWGSPTTTRPKHSLQNHRHVWLTFTF